METFSFYCKEEFSFSVHDGDCEIKSKEVIYVCGKEGLALDGSNSLELKPKKPENLKVEDKEVAMKEYKIEPANSTMGCHHMAMCNCQPPGSPTPIVSSFPMAIKLDGTLTDKLSEKVKIGGKEFAVEGSLATLKNHKADPGKQNVVGNDPMFMPVDLAQGFKSVVSYTNGGAPMIMAGPKKMPDTGEGAVQAVGCANTVSSEGKKICLVGAFVNTCDDVKTPMLAKIKKK